MWNVRRPRLVLVFHPKFMVHKQFRIFSELAEQALRLTYGTEGCRFESCWVYFNQGKGLRRRPD
jgi:hypothetical protein